MLLPPLSAIPYRMLTFKDVYGTFSNSTLTISTQGGNTFEDSTTSIVLSNAFSFYNLYAASTSWLVLDGTQTLVQSISTLNVNSINIGNGIGWLQFGPIQTVAVSTSQIFTDGIYANSISSFSLSTAQLSVSSIVGAPLIYTSTLVSTTLGLQTYISTFIDTSELASTVRNLVSSTFFASQLASTVTGLGTAGYVSTAALSGHVSTANLLNLVSTPNLLNLVSTPNLLNHVSTPNLLNLVSTPNLLNLVSTPNLLNLLSTGSILNFVSTPNLLNLVSTPNLLNLISTQNLLNLVSTPNLLNLLSTGSILNFVSTPNLLNLVSTQNLLNLISSPNLLGLVSTTYLQSQLVSTVAGLSNVAVTKLIAGSNITLSPVGGVGDVTVNASASNWAVYPAISSVVLQTTFPKIINPVPDALCIFESQNLALQDSNNAPGTFLANILGITTSTSSAGYFFTNRYAASGIISTASLLYSDGSTLATGSLYLSSIYLGGIGGSPSGYLTTDLNATNIYWNGTQLNGGGGGGGITTGNLVSTTSGLQTNFIGQQGYFSTLFLNMTSATAPAWSSSNPIAGSDPEPNPLALDIYGSTRILKNLYVGSTTTIVGTAGIYAQTVSTNTTTAKQMNFSSLFVNNAPIIVDSNGNLIATTQVF